MFKDYPNSLKEINIYRENLKNNWSTIYQKAINPENIPEKPGIYLMAQIAANPLDPSDLYYCIKIGKSKNLKRRVLSYATTAPFNRCVAAYVCPEFRLIEEEQKWHRELEKCFPRTNGEKSEWFFVPAIDYYGFLKNNFKNYLPNSWNYDKYIENLKREMPE